MIAPPLRIEDGTEVALPLGSASASLPMVECAMPETASRQASSTVTIPAVAACSSTGTSRQGTDFAPYVEVTGAHPALDQLAGTTGQRDFVLAFVLAGESGCTPTWGATKSLADSTILREVTALKAMGGGSWEPAVSSR
ncbi:hypothetical protein [Amycolatopsis sp.]|uniref:hypothetical protein n=1 Tax=Amycolatopsis sp. TaxID=37632 RepID=UPI002C157ED1|nr:hypothetical protein [Amycolatopsis sp.]HVV11910.1 hypothetical protein [Amycolatopsis sp.]